MLGYRKLRHVHTCILAGSVGIISTAREDWVPSADSSVAEVKDERKPEVSVVPKGRSDSESLRTVERAQADWIRQYMEQQEEVFLLETSSSTKRYVGYAVKLLQFI